MFINLQLEWYQVAAILLVAALIYLVHALAFLLPILGVISFLRGRWLRGVILLGLGLGAAGYSLAPGLVDRMRFAKVADVVEASTILREAPDLTGQTVAILTDIPPGDEVIPGCKRLMESSGAARVYLLRSYVDEGQYYANIRLDTVWGGPVDLTRMIVAEVELAPAPLLKDEPDPQLLCRLGPKPAAPRPIDRVFAFDLPLDDAGVQKNLLKGAIAQQDLPWLLYYTAPVADQQNFLLGAQGAEILIPQASRMVRGIPYPLADRSLSAPSRDDAALFDLVEKMLCRNQGGRCAN